MNIVFYSRQLLLIALISALPATAFSQIYTNTFTGASTCPTPGNVPVIAANATGSGLARTSVICNPTVSTFNSTTLNNTSTVTDSYIQFSVTADAGYQLNLTSLSFFRQGSSTSPNQLEVRYSTDGFVTSYTSWGGAPATPSIGSAITWNFDDFSTTMGETVTFRIYPYGTQRVSGTGNSLAGGTFRLDDIVVNGTVTSVLPVKLISFQSTAEENAVFLKWSTAWEEENEGFVIEKSSDAISFEEAGYVEGNVTLATSSEYEYRDKDVQSSQTYYYRLKQLDLDGSFEYSRIISGKVSGTNIPESYVFPNPNQGSFALRSVNEKSGIIRLYNSTGLEIPVSTSTAESDQVVLINPKTALLPGLYQLKVHPVNGKPEWLKVVVNN